MPGPSLRTAASGGGGSRGAPRERALALLVAGATLAFAFAIGPRGYSYEHTWEYVRMIEGGPADASAPFAYRVLVPFLVKAVPLEPWLGFLILTFASSALMLLGLFVLLRDLSLPLRSSLVAMVLAGFSYPVALYLNYWGMVDPVANLFVVAALLALRRERWALASLSLVLGVLAKEANLMLAPLFAWSQWRRGGSGRRHRLIQLLLVAAPVVAVALPRVLIHPAPGRWDLHGWDDLRRFWGTLWEMKAGDAPHVWLAGVFLRSYGFFWVMAALGFAHQREWRGICVYLLLCGAALCLAATDWARMLGFGFVGVFIPVAMLLARREGIRNGTAWLLLLVVLAALQCWLALAPFRAMPEFLARIHPAATLTCFLLGAIVAIAFDRKPGPARAARVGSA